MVGVKHFELMWNRFHARSVEFTPELDAEAERTTLARAVRRRVGRARTLSPLQNTPTPNGRNAVNVEIDSQMSPVERRLALLP